MQQGRRILVVGDLNIAPAAIDRCDAGPDFEKNECVFTKILNVYKALYVPFCR